MAGNDLHVPAAQREEQYGRSPDNRDNYLSALICLSILATVSSRAPIS